MISQAGQITAVAVEPQGAISVSWVGNTLSVVNAADFPREGGEFTISGDPATVFHFSAVVEGEFEGEPDVVTTLESAPAGFSPDTRLDIYPPAIDVTAEVELYETADSVRAVVPHALRLQLREGVRELEDREWVTIELRGQQWFVSEVIGRQPSIASGSVEGLADALGQLDDALTQLDEAMAEAQTGLSDLDAALAQARADLENLDEALDPSNPALASRITASMATFQTVYANSITANMLNVDNALAQKLQATMATFGTVFANTLTANMIQAESFAGYTISGANIYSPGATDTPRTQIVGPTLSVVRADTEGREFPTVQLGGGTADQVMLFDASGGPIGGFDQDGNGLAKTMSISDDIQFSDFGSLVTYFNRLPKGLVAAYKVPTSPTTGSAEMGIADVGWDAEPGHVYLVEFDVYLTIPQNVRAQLLMRAISGASGASATNPTVANSVLWNSGIYVGPTDAGGLVRCHLSHVATHPYTVTTEHRVLMTLKNATSTSNVSVNGAGPGWIRVTDLGAFYGSDFNDGRPNQGGVAPTSGANTPPATVKKTYTTAWDSVWNRSWRGGSIVTDGTLHQGYYGGSQRTTQIGFPAAIQTALTGSQVSRIEVYLENLTWYYGSGGKIRIGTHGNAAAGAEKNNSSPGPFDSATWVAGGKGWVTIPSSWYSSFATGAYKGITLGEGAGTNLTYYGKFRNTLSAAKIRATYTK